MAYQETLYEEPSGHLIECEWSAHTSKDEITVYPDGCADLLFDEQGRVYLYGISDKSFRSKAGPKVFFRGLRLKPGAIPTLFGVPAVEFRNKAVPVADIPSRLAKTIANLARHCDHQNQLLRLTVPLLLQACARCPRPRYLTFALSKVEVQSIRSVAAALGVTERHLHRIFLREAGIGPAKFRKIRRLQRVIDTMRRLPRSIAMADLASDFGYFDQAHLYHDVKAITGQTPAELLHDLSC
jgi:AraC-like DNA-binding protein